MTERGRVTAATATEATMKASDGDEGNGEGNSGGGRATVMRVEGMARATRAAMATATRVEGDEEDEGIEEGNESFFSQAE